MKKKYFCAKFEAINGVIKAFGDFTADDNIGAEKFEEMFETTLEFIKKIIAIK